jgi:NADPH:quinone reductase-like Zn-dependent oxidoreductase
MKAVRMHEFGGPEVLRYEEVPDPVLRKDHVLIRIRACALNHLDLWVRKGLPGVKLPHTLGSDIAGEVAKCGEYITDLKVGTRVLLSPMLFCGHCEQCNSGRQNFCTQFAVLGNNAEGGNCELITVPRVNVIPIPDSLAFVDAASVPLVFLTAWHMLVGNAKLRAGQSVLVLGASSGVGSAAIQIGKMLGALVITTAGDERKLAKARELGADHTINHYKQKISDEVKRITNRGGVDVVFEHVGVATWPESIKSLKYGGTLVTCGATTGYDAALDLRVLFARQLSFYGSYMGAEGELDEVLKHIFSGRLKPIVDKSFPLSETRAAHEHLASSEQFGKVVVVP